MSKRRKDLYRKKRNWIECSTVVAVDGDRRTVMMSTVKVRRKDYVEPTELLWRV